MPRKQSVPEWDVSPESDLLVATGKQWDESFKAQTSRRWRIILNDIIRRAKYLGKNWKQGTKRRTRKKQRDRYSSSSVQGHGWRGENEIEEAGEAEKEEKREEEDAHMM